MSDLSEALDRMKCWEHWIKIGTHVETQELKDARLFAQRIAQLEGLLNDRIAISDEHGLEIMSLWERMKEVLPFVKAYCSREIYERFRTAIRDLPMETFDEHK